MSNLRDALETPREPDAHRSRPGQPSGFEYQWDGHDGTISTGPMTERPRTWDHLIRDAGLDPAEVYVQEPVQVRGWDAIKRNTDGSSDKVRQHYYRLTIRKRLTADLPDLPSLLDLTRRARRKPKERPEQPHKAVVAVYADAQTGKVASRGGTKELLARMDGTLTLLDDYCRAMKADEAVLLDAGDTIEGFENTAGQMHTNDLDLMSQVEVAADIELAFIDLLAKRHSQVRVAGVGSNHCRWRQGKNQLGAPSADWGLHILRQMRKMLAMNDTYSHVAVTWPDTYDETLALDVCGTIVGLAHGHQASRPDRVPAWWADQVHGGQPLSHAEILVTGHFHTFRTQSSGRDPHTGREKRWFQAPTLDNGSDWFKLNAGDDSDPGMLVFTVSERGWGDLQILRPAG